MYFDYSWTAMSTPYDWHKDVDYWQFTHSVIEANIDTTLQTLQKLRFGLFLLYLTNFLTLYFSATKCINLGLTNTAFCMDKSFLTIMNWNCI